MPDVQDQVLPSCKGVWNLQRWNFGSVESFEEKMMWRKSVILEPFLFCLLCLKNGLKYQKNGSI